jgi:hypothetical protein
MEKDDFLVVSGDLEESEERVLGEEPDLGEEGLLPRDKKFL